MWPLYSYFYGRPYSLTADRTPLYTAEWNTVQPSRSFCYVLIFLFTSFVTLLMFNFHPPLTSFLLQCFIIFLHLISSPLYLFYHTLFYSPSFCNSSYFSIELSILLLPHHSIFVLPFPIMFFLSPCSPTTPLPLPPRAQMPHSGSNYSHTQQVLYSNAFVFFTWCIYCYLIPWLMFLCRWHFFLLIHNRFLCLLMFV